MSIAALVGATDFNAGHFLAQRFDCVIAVDGGYASLQRIGVSPDYVVGDFDSLQYVPQRDDVLCYPCEKDESDMELAMRLAQERGCGTLFVYGALAGRLDHTIANLQLLARCARSGFAVFGVGDSFALTVLDGSGRSKVAFDSFDPSFLDAGEYGRCISVFAYGGVARGVTESGLKYGLDSADVGDDCSLGLSNEFTGGAALVGLEEGNVVVTFPIGAFPYMKGLDMRPLPGMICAINRAKEDLKHDDAKEGEKMVYSPIPSVLSIAGSDSCGGAGIQADIKTITALRLYAQTAITALTAQDTAGVYGIENVSPAFVRQQIDVVFQDIRPDAVKIGMISSADIANAIADGLQANDATGIVLDPVMVSTSGSALMADATISTLVERLFPLADVLTPNLPEAEVLAGMKIEDKQGMLEAAKAIHAMMRPDAYVLVKGGHLSDSADDLLYGADGAEWICAERIETQNSHGTGCSLSSAIACGLALGKTMAQSVRDAKDYLSGALAHDPHMGKGNGPLDHMWAYRA